jgi:hypothetical protein
MKASKALSLACALLLCSLSGAQSPAKPDPWAGLRFLLGFWQARTVGGTARAETAGAYSFQWEFAGHLLARHSSDASCKGPRDFDCQHRDLLYIYPEGPAGAFQAIYFDNEGHVIRYSVTTPRPDTAVFLSDPAPPGPQFRLSYELAEGVMTGRFALRQAGQTEFRSYLEWSGRRQ